jgi:Ca-activated chloride channel family protein
MLVACSGAAETVEVTRVVTQTIVEEGEVVEVVVTRIVTEEVEVALEAPHVSGAIVATAPPLAAAPQSQVQVEPVFPTSPAWQPTSTPPPVPPRDMFFQTYGVNPFIPAAIDHLSTFALDVDTGAYSIARRYVRDGLLPPVEAIRVEEFVNYFDQEYPIPPDAAFAIYADGAPSPFHYDGTYILRIGIQGHSVSEVERPPASLTFVIDVSGSMSQENRLELVKQSLQMLVDRLRSDDRVAIVVYGTDARIVLEPTTGFDKRSILNAIFALSPEGSTNAEAGLRLGYEMANATYLPGGINRVILVSDGVANVGLTNPDALSQRIRGYADSGITLTTIGVGMGNYNDTLMEQLADKGEGYYAYVDTPAEARKLFVEELTSTLQTIAIDAKVQVDFNPDVVNQYRLIGYENRAVADQDFRNDAVDAGEIGAGHTATALYAVQFLPGSSGRIATVQLRWQDPDSRQVREINGNFNTWDLVDSFELAAPRYQLAVVVSQYAELLRHSYWSGDVTLAQLNVLAQRVSGALPYDEDVAEFAGLVARASQLRR